MTITADPSHHGLEVPLRPHRPVRTNIVRARRATLWKVMTHIQERQRSRTAEMTMTGRGHHLHLFKQLQANRKVFRSKSGLMPLRSGIQRITLRVKNNDPNTNSQRQGQQSMQMGASIKRDLDAQGWNIHGRAPQIFFGCFVKQRHKPGKTTLHRTRVGCSRWIGRRLRWQSRTRFRGRGRMEPVSPAPTKSFRS